MKIFVMRHGEAQAFANSDQERCLTERGKRQVYEQGMWLKSVQDVMDKVLVSPYLRAQQSFEQVNLAYQNQLKNKLETWNGITPYGDANLVLDYLNVLSEENTQAVLIISHLPLVGDIVRTLCGRNSVSFYPSTIVQIEKNSAMGIVTKINYP